MSLKKDKRVDENLNQENDGSGQLPEQEQTKSFFFPKENRSIKAVSYEDAVAILAKEKEVAKPTEMQDEQ